MATVWTCEDEEEALGLELVMQRVGVPVTISERDGALVVEAEGERAEQLYAAIVRHYVRRDDRERATRFAARERWRSRAFMAALALGGLALAILALR